MENKERNRLQFDNTIIPLTNTIINLKINLKNIIQTHYKKHVLDNRFYQIYRPPTHRQPTTDHLPTDPLIVRPQTHRPTDAIIIFKRLENSKTFTLQNTNTAEKM